MTLSRTRCRAGRPRQFEATLEKTFDASGFTLSELLVALTIALVVSAGVVKLADDARTFFTVQPEVMDVTQRARVGVDLLNAELASAGAGASLGTDAGPLIRWIPPIEEGLPCWIGSAGAAALIARRNDRRNPADQRTGVRSQ